LAKVGNKSAILLISSAPTGTRREHSQRQEKLSCEKRWPLRLLRLLSAPRWLPQQEVLASDCSAAGYSTKAGMKGWIGLHRPDGEVVRIKTGQIVFVMSAANTGADKRSLSRIQLLNGFADVRENVDEVMLAIKNVDVLM
jgi:hypothetical protein